ncbi:hypothetical protein F4X86_03580 [Candidatus Saccharibacteria bacterium]|nr:hypothetical protein [Candidatus Saccharibacteria bacterium]
MKLDKVKGWNWHLILGFLYLLQVVLIFFLADSGLFRSLDVSFLSHNSLTGAEQTAVKTLYELDLKHILLLIPVGLGALHLIFGFKKGFYKQVLKNRVNVWRWLIVGIASGLMLVTTALILGIADITYLALLGASMIGFSWLGIIAEHVQASVKPSRGRPAKAAQKDALPKQTLNLVMTRGKASGLLPWLVVGASLAAGLILGDDAFSWYHLFIYLAGICLIVVWLWNATYGTGGKQARTYCAVETVYFGSAFVCISAWLWLVTLLGA